MYGLDEENGQQRATELIEFFDLIERQNKWIETYSSGMKKKVLLAAAFIPNPQLLILDEPLEGVDPISARSIKSNLRLMAKHGVTVVISSHVLDTIEKICDEIALIHQGKKLLQCKTKELERHIRKKFPKEHSGVLEKVFFERISGHSKGPAGKLSWLDD